MVGVEKLHCSSIFLCFLLKCLQNVEEIRKFAASMTKYVEIMRHFLLAIMMMTTIVLSAQVVDDIYGDIKDGNDVQLSIVTPAKPDKASKQSQKEREKLLKQRVDSLGHAKAAMALERGYWVLVADRINVGYTAYTAAGLDGNSNFVFQQAQEGVVQFAFNHANPGTNGMGGMTMKGRVSDVKMRTDKKGNINYSYVLLGEDINAHIDITVYAGSDYAQAIVEPAFSGPRLTFNGRLVPYIRPRQ